jgi:hypothetical protein
VDVAIVAVLSLDTALVLHSSWSFETVLETNRLSLRMMAHMDGVVGVEKAMSEGVSASVVPGSKIEEHSLLADPPLTGLSQMYG